MLILLKIVFFCAAFFPAAPLQTDEEDPITGVWEGMLDSDQIPKEQSNVTLFLKLEEKGKVSGRVAAQGTAIKLAEGGFIERSGTLTLVFDNPAGMEIEILGIIKDGKLKATVEVVAADFTADLTAKRIDKKFVPEKSKGDKEEEKEEKSPKDDKGKDTKSKKKGTEKESGNKKSKSANSDDATSLLQ